MTRAFVSDQLGPWTGQVPELSEDELLYGVALLAMDHGWPIDPVKVGMLERFRDEIDRSPVYGKGRLLIDAERPVLAELARRAVAWLNEQRADDKRFVLTNALYLLGPDQPDSDASTERYPFYWVSDAARAAGHVNPPLTNGPA